MRKDGNSVKNNFCVYNIIMAVTKKRTTRKRSKRPGSLKIKTPLASVGLSGRKRGIGLRAKAKAFGLGVGGKFGVHRKGANWGSSFSAGRAKAKVNTKVKFNGGVKARAKTRLGVRRTPIVSANVGSGLTKKRAYAGGKFDFLGLGGFSADGGLEYGKGLPSIGAGGSVSLGKQKLGGSLQLGGKKIINAKLNVPLFGRGLKTRIVTIFVIELLFVSGLWIL